MALAGKRAVVFGVQQMVPGPVARMARGRCGAGGCVEAGEHTTVETLAASLGSGDGVKVDEACRTLICDVTDESAIRSVFESVSKNGSRPVHSVLHAVAAAPPAHSLHPSVSIPGRLLSAQLVSAYSLISTARCALPVMETTTEDHSSTHEATSTSSITNLTYMAHRALCLVGIMGTAKAS